MRNNRDKWQFYKHPSKPSLSNTEVRYWKEQLKSLLKVGIEFEFNLSSQAGSCRGNNVRCPCIHIDDGCWMLCTKFENCSHTASCDTCKNRTAKCAPDKCASCGNYEFQCLGVACTHFVSQCTVCDKFEKNCESCPDFYNPKLDPKLIREKLTGELQPSRSYGKVSQSGVVAITTDGSLKGDRGVEIITIGRRVDYWEFYKMSKNIIDKVVNYGGYLNERTGSHMHVLTSYYDEANANELERPMPEIILANFHQLCRRYQNALVWMTMGLDDPNHMTRWEKFRVSILDISPVTNDMGNVVAKVSDIAGGNKYSLVNYNRLRFSNNGDIARFHVEFREADSTLCPTYYAAIACLHFALVIKSVEISRYGLLKVGDSAWLKQAKEMKKLILNGRGDYSGPRTSNTSKVLDNTEFFIEESLDMIAQLKNILLKMGPAYDVLLKIAKKPVALRRIDGYTWDEIENDLNIEMGPEDKFETKLLEIIDLRLIDDCRTIDEWVSEVRKVLKEDEEFDGDVTIPTLMKYIENKTREGELIWSESIGCMLAI